MIRSMVSASCLKSTELHLMHAITKILPPCSGFGIRFEMSQALFQHSHGLGRQFRGISERSGRASPEFPGENELLLVVELGKFRVVFDHCP